VIKYIGSKRTLLPQICAVVRSFPEVRSVLDVFSGTARVGHALKARGLSVTANDHNAYAATLARCYVAADRARVEVDARRLLREFQGLRGQPGWFTQTYCLDSRFFQPKNGERIDAIREAIEHRDPPPDVRAVVLVALMEAADRVDSTVGLQMAYLKQWAPRANNDLELRMPEVLPGTGHASQLDALDAVESRDVDLVYLDPPYNQHKYLGNYHIWETLVRWDKPEVYGVARKRVDCREYRSPYNGAKAILPALRRLVRACRARHLVVSFNDEGFVSCLDMEEMLAERGHVRRVEVDFRRYVGAKIGIHSPAGEKVGTVGRLRNREYLWVVSDDAAAVERAVAAVAASEG
jgi:adenine-specific DNA-methyltransferase